MISPKSDYIEGEIGEARMYQGFPVSLTDLIRCQEDLEALSIEENEGGSDFIQRGSLKCSKCGTIYNIDKGILELLPCQEPLQSVVQHEVETRDIQAKDYDKLRYTGEDEVEISSTLKHLGAFTGKNLIEFGCGIGRYTTIIASKCRQVIALDFSRESLLILAGKLKDADNTGLVWADATKMRVAPDYFDLALSAQVVEHIPSVEARSLFFQRIFESLSPEGMLLCTAYHQDVMRRIRELKHEGYHPSGIFYHYFSKEEMKNEVSKHFATVIIYLIQPHIPYARRFHIISPILFKTFQALPILNKLGRLILVKAYKREK